jgi:hypothetical protein
VHLRQEPNTYSVCVNRVKDSGERLYTCPCGQAPNPEMRGITAYMTSTDDMSKACRHIGLVVLFERTCPGVVTAVTPEAGDEIMNTGEEILREEL